MKARTLTSHLAGRACLIAIFMAAASGVLYQLHAQQLVTFNIRQIEADNSGRGIDSGLDDIKKDLQRISYDTFRLNENKNVKCRLKEDIKLELLGENRLELRPLGFDGEKIRFEFKFSGKKTWNTTLLLQNGGTFIFVGPSYGDGVLILALTSSR
jgi:hypothetical protein